MFVSVKRNARFTSDAVSPFAVSVRTRTRTYVVPLHVLAIRQRATASARDRCPVVAESVTL